MRKLVVVFLLVYFVTINSLKAVMVSSDYGHSAGLPGSMYYAKISGVLLLFFCWFILQLEIVIAGCH